jgi:hypothetical protein
MKDKQYEFIKIVDMSFTQPQKKTQTFHVLANKYNQKLGYINWNTGWRCYAFYTESDTFYEEKCLRNIAEFLEELKNERKNVQKT